MYGIGPLSRQGRQLRGSCAAAAVHVAEKGNFGAAPIVIPEWMMYVWMIEVVFLVPSTRCIVITYNHGWIRSRLGSQSVRAQRMACVCLREFGR